MHPQRKYFICNKKEKRNYVLTSYDFKGKIKKVSNNNNNYRKYLSVHCLLACANYFMYCFIPTTKP